MLAEARGAAHTHLVFEDKLFARSDVPRTVVASAAHALAAEVVIAGLDAAAALLVARHDAGAVSEVTDEVLALGDAEAPVADLLAVLNEGAVLRAKAPAAVLTQADRAIAAGRERPPPKLTGRANSGHD
jgi:hypothetical protein